jgi:hypothetical protein
MAFNVLLNREQTIDELNREIELMKKQEKETIKNKDVNKDFSGNFLCSCVFNWCRHHADFLTITDELVISRYEEIRHTFKCAGKYKNNTEYGSKTPGVETFLANMANDFFENQKPYDNREFLKDLNWQERKEYLEQELKLTTQQDELIRKYNKIASDRISKQVLLDAIEKTEIIKGTDTAFKDLSVQDLQTILNLFNKNKDK